MKILITGGKGQLGKALSICLEKKYKVFSLDKTQLDITNDLKSSKIIYSIKPDIIINCAGISDIDECERKPSLAYKVNLYGTRNLVIEAVKNNIIIMQISTDQIFDGTKKIPYNEDDQPNPINVYGKSKWLAEQLIKSFCDRYYIIRTSRIFSPYGENFVTTFYNKVKNKQPLRIIDGEVSSPTYSKDLALSIYYILNTQKFGTYHITNSGFCNWLEFAKAIVKNIDDGNIKLISVSPQKANRYAPRPEFSVLNTEKMARVLKYNLPHWEEALVECMKRINC